MAEKTGEVNRQHSTDVSVQSPVLRQRGQGSCLSGPATESLPHPLAPSLLKEWEPGTKHPAKNACGDFPGTTPSNRRILFPTLLPKTQAQETLQPTLVLPGFGSLTTKPRLRCLVPYSLALYDGALRGSKLLAAPGGPGTD